MAHKHADRFLLFQLILYSGTSWDASKSWIFYFMDIFMITLSVVSSNIHWSTSNVTRTISFFAKIILRNIIRFHAREEIATIMYVRCTCTIVLFTDTFIYSSWKKFIICQKYAGFKTFLFLLEMRLYCFTLTNYFFKRF